MNWKWSSKMQETLKSFINDPWWLISTSMSESLTEELEKELSQKHISLRKRSCSNG